MITLIIAFLLISVPLYVYIEYRSRKRIEFLDGVIHEQKQLISTIQEDIAKYKNCFELEQKNSATLWEYNNSTSKQLIDAGNQIKQLKKEIEDTKSALDETVEAANSAVKVADDLAAVNESLKQELDSHEVILEKAAELAEAPARVAPMPIELNCPCGMHKQHVAVDLRYKHQDYKCSRCNKTCGIQVKLMTTQIPQGATMENYPLATQVGVTDLTGQA